MLVGLYILIVINAEIAWMQNRRVGYVWRKELERSNDAVLKSHSCIQNLPLKSLL